MSMITASLWVPRGAAAAFPTRYDLDEHELARISKLAKLQLEDAKVDLENAAREKGDTTETEDSDAEGIRVKQPLSQGDIDDDLKEYDLDNYDTDADARDGETTAILGNVQSLAYHTSNAEDPYLTLQDNEEDEEREDLQILATDNLVVAAKVEDEVAHLEVYVYEDVDANLYVHHDIMLPAIPLCVEWLDLPVTRGNDSVNTDSRGNFVAVGTFEPDIEIWDLDTIDCMYPNAILGQGGEETENAIQEQKKKKKRKKSKKANEDYHVDAVLSLAANRLHRNLLASSSADKTVKLWDLKTTKCAKSYSLHTGKVCSIAWHPRESTVLLSGSYDRTVVAADMRAPDAKIPRWQVESDVETVIWDPHDPNFFYVTTENGIVHYYDIRSAPPTPEASKTVWTLQAHDESISCFDINPVVPGFLATGSTDRTVKLWDIQQNRPSMVVCRNVEVGKVFSAKFGPDAEVAFRLAVAGSKGAMQIWDTSTNAGVRRAFATRIAPSDREVKEERIVRLQEGSTDSDSEGEEEEEEEEDGGVKPSGTGSDIEKDQNSMDES